MSAGEQLYIRIGGFQYTVGEFSLEISTIRKYYH